MSSSILPKKFVSMHSHTNSSISDGFGGIDEHMNYVREIGGDAYCVTEHGNQLSTAKGWAYIRDLESKGINFKFVPGCELYLHPDLATWKSEYDVYKSLDKKTKKSELEDDAETGIAIENEDKSKTTKKQNPLNRRHHLLALPKSVEGMRNLFTLITLSYREPNYYRYPRIDFKMLKEYGKDLILSSACLAGTLSYEVMSHFPNIDWNDIDPNSLDDENLMNKVLLSVGNVVDRLVDCVGQENFYLELQFNKLNPQHLVNRALLEYSKRTNLKLIATCDSHYPRPELWKAREIYKKLAWMNYETINPDSIPKSVDELKCELYPRNAEMMWSNYKNTTSQYSFYDDQIICDAIERTYDIVHNQIENIKFDASPKLSSAVVPEDKTAIKALYDLCKEGLIKKGLDKKQEYVNRLKTELAMIKKKGFEKYFLLINKIMQIANENMLVGPARGSSGGSLVLYLLDVVQIDPIEHGLLFSRFLSAERVEFPDVDTDIADRDLLIAKLREFFGKNNVLYISNINTFKLKSLVKDVSKFYGVPFEEVNEVTKVVETHVKAATIKPGDDKNLFELKYEDAIEHSKPFREFMEKYPQVAETVQLLNKQPKSLSAHAGGTLILDHPEREMPVISVRGEYQSPWVEGLTEKTLESNGFLKFDLLGLKTLRAVQRCIEYILQSKGIEKPTFKQVKEWYDDYLHPDKLKMVKLEVFDNVYGQGKFPNLFQFTSRGAQSFIEKFEPKSVIDIAVATSIYRPGPLGAHVDKLYLECKNDKSKIKYKNSLILEVLKETSGCIVFQESVMALANKVGGFSLDDSDKVRKALMKRTMNGKDAAAKKQQELGKKFIEGAMINGLNKHEAEEIWGDMLYFSGYGFNKSHAVAYAYDSVMCAYLFTYYPDEWLCAWLEMAQDNPEEKENAIGECRRYGYKIVPLDINYAKKTWTSLEGKRLMGSLSSVQGIGDVAVDEILKYRPYKELCDFFWNEDGTWRHSKANKRVWDVLTKLEAMESVGLVGEGKLFSNYRQFNYVLTEGPDILKKKNGIEKLKDIIDEACKLEDWTQLEKAEFHQKLSGDMTVSMLLPEEIQEKLKSFGVKEISEVTGKDIAWFVLTDYVEKKTKTGKDYLLLSVVDNSGKTSKIFLWGGKVCSFIKKNTVYISEVSKSDFGYATNFRQMKKIDGEDDIN